MSNLGVIKFNQNMNIVGNEKPKDVEIELFDTTFPKHMFSKDLKRFLININKCFKETKIMMGFMVNSIMFYGLKL